MGEQMSELFNVCQFFADDSYEYVRRGVDIKEVEKAFLHYTTSVGARLGTTKRVIITDMGDNINAEWKFGEGLVYPTKEMIDASRKAEQDNA